jgi:prepilin-type N-terminal cleavage/methylation domain-containing protein
MRFRLRHARGFSLIELTVVIVVIGIMAGIAMQSLTVAVEDGRKLQTERKLDLVAKGIVGDPGIMQDGVRSDFGYVGDIGAFPPNLAALYTNPGLALWNGPYVQIDHTEDTISYRTDSWGQALAYSGGVMVTSSGHGTPIVRKLCDSTTDYLLNTVVGAIRDKNDSTPGSIMKDSVSILVDIPSGPSGMVTRSYKPTASGTFACDSVPAGRRFFRFIYMPGNDTVRRYYTVLPRHQNDPQLIVKFAGAWFSGGGSGCTGASTVTLRPNGAGTITNIPNRPGCAANWQCVSEITADDAISEVSINSSSWATDVYALSDPPSLFCNIVSVKVSGRALRDQTQGDIQPSVYVGGTEYNGASTPLTNSWTNYSHTWATNPATGAAWSWADITNLQAGARIRGQSVPFSARLTQVWVVVTY